MIGRTHRAAGRRTQADMIREVLSDRIVHGFLSPGDPLDETTLAAEFGVSRTPVREALRQLETIGLALSRPHRGTIVTALSDGEFRNMFRVMAELEALCARLCAEAMSEAEREALHLLQQDGRSHVEAGAIDRYRQHNERFHDTIYAGAHNPFLEDLTRGVRRRLAPFRKAQFEAEQRIEQSHKEHSLVIDAILARDPEAAARAMLNHMIIVERKVGEVAPEFSAAAQRKDSAPRRDPHDGTAAASRQPPPP